MRLTPKIRRTHTPALRCSEASIRFGYESIIVAQLGPVSWKEGQYPEAWGLLVPGPSAVPWDTLGYRCSTRYSIHTRSFEPEVHTGLPVLSVSGCSTTPKFNSPIFNVESLTHVDLRVEDGRTPSGRSSNKE